MALRPIFLPNYYGSTLVDTVMTEFEWVSGLSKTQKMKNVFNLHEAFSKERKVKILEVSSKSVDKIGSDLSAFNLLIFNERLNRNISVESAYQGSKVFEKGGAFFDIYEKSSLDAKRDERLKKSGGVIGFNYNNDIWDVFPENAFYNYLYITSLKCNELKYAVLEEYSAFTDIEFNPRKSINCQAYAVALYLSLKKRGLINEAMKDKSSFLCITESFDVVNSRRNTVEQSTLF